jgi:threonine dehydrogenase-like Zn-dependent dehydrogenase
MWAMRLTAPLAFEPVETPAPTKEDLADGQVLLRVLAGGLCGSDAPFYRGAVGAFNADGHAKPGFPLHEVVGEVVASRSPYHSVTDRVVGWATGMDGLQELVITDGESLQSYDAGLDPAEAVMIQPLACVLFAVERLGDVTGQHCAVFGQGPIGVLFSHVLKSSGAAKVTGIDRVDRRDILPDFGVDQPVFASTAQWVVGLAEPDRPDVVVEAIGHQVSTLTQAVEAVRPLGRILYYGVPDDQVYPFPMETFLRKHLTLTSCSTLDRRRVMAAANDYLADHPDLLGRYLTHQFPLEKTSEAYASAFTPKPGQLKTVISAVG